MENNMVLKKISIALKLQHHDIVNIYGLVGRRLSCLEVENFLKKADDPTFRPLGDDLIKCFLNGLIIYKRGAIRQNKVRGHQY